MDAVPPPLSMLWSLKLTMPAVVCQWGGQNIYIRNFASSSGDACGTRAVYYYVQPFKVRTVLEYWKRHRSKSKIHIQNSLSTTHLEKPW